MLIQFCFCLALAEPTRAIQLEVCDVCIMCSIVVDTHTHTHPSIWRQKTIVNIITMLYAYHTDKFIAQCFIFFCLSFFPFAAAVCLFFILFHNIYLFIYLDSWLVGWSLRLRWNMSLAAFFYGNRFDYLDKMKCVRKRRTAIATKMAIHIHTHTHEQT